MKTDADSPRQPQPVRFSDGEKAIIREAARVNRQPFTTFIREAALSAAGDCLERPVRPTSAMGPVHVLTPSGVIR